MRKLALTIILIGLFLTSLSSGHDQGQADPKTGTVLAPAPAPVSAGASLAAVVGLVGAPIDSVFALRGGNTNDFWHYSISQNQWTILPPAPAPVGEGGGAVEVHSWDACKPGRFYVAAMRGAHTTDFWYFNIDENRWCAGPGMPAPVGQGGAIAQLQGSGKIYVLRGEGTTDFWSLASGEWKALASTPGPVNAGGGLVGINYGTRSQRRVLYALQGGGSSAVWKYDVETNTWTHQSDVPAPIGPGGAITSPNIGDEGTLNVLQGGGSTTVWSLDVASDAWKPIAGAPSAVSAGGATSNQFNGCNFTFVGGGSNQFFATGLWNCTADAPAPGFSLYFSQPTVTVARGTKVKATLNIVRSGGFTGNVTIFAPEALPAGVRLPDGLVPGAVDSITFKVKIKEDAAVGTHTLTFTGSDGGGKRQTATLTLTVRE